MIRPVAMCLVCLSLAACGGPSPGAAEAKTWCGRYNAALEAVLVRCYRGPKDLVATGYAAADAAECEDLFRAVGAGRARFDAKAASACLSALGTLACADVDTFKGPANPCNQAVTGTVAAGDACYEDLDCTSGSYCAWVGPGTCPARCTALAGRGGDCSQGQACDFGLACDGQTCQPAAAKGQPCGGPTGTFCDAGLYCAAVSATAGLCKAKGTAGAGCTDPAECETSLSCISGRCAALRTAGQACTADTDCGLDLYCASGKCTRDPVVGGTCGDLGGGHYAGCIASWCKLASPSASTGSCAAFLEPGDACNQADAGACGSGACLGGTCAPACAER